MMREATRNALNEAYPGGLGYVNGVMDTLYLDGPLTHRDRERCLIALLACRQEPFPLGLHLYWGLMEGLNPDEVKHTLLLAGAYHGICVHATGLLVMRKTSTMLRGLAAEGDSAVNSALVLRKFIEVFQP